MNTNTYNGWTNYATWRIALEWFDGFNPNKFEKDIYTLSLELKCWVEDSLHEMILKENFVLDYAMAFTADVNWYEIAEHLIEEEVENE